MKNTDIFRELGGIDPNVIESSAPGKRIKRRTSNAFVRWGSLAACLALILTVCILTIPEASTPDEPNEPAYVNYSELTSGRSTTGFSQVSQEESLRIYSWSWDQKTPDEKYGKFTINGQSYGGRGSIVGEEFLGDVIGVGEASGTDSETNIKYTENFEARRIKGLDEGHSVAVNFDGTYYLFSTMSIHSYAIDTCPDTFGELMDAFALSETLPFSNFSVADNNETNYYNLKHYALTDSKGFWDILLKCKDAEVSTAYAFNYLDGSLSFTATSGALDLYKLNFTVSTSGEIFTNICSIGLSFKIGKDAANELIDYALAHSVESTAEPYEYFVVGYITEINDDYFVIDDSAICTDPSDGISYRVPLDNLKIRREIDRFYEVGSFVGVAFSGTIDVANGNTVIGATRFERFRRFSDGDWGILE